MLFRTRQMFIGQRTQTINALHSHLAEHGVVAPKGAIPLPHSMHPSDHTRWRE